jgi:hypothetical protein
MTGKGEVSIQYLLRVIYTTCMDYRNIQAKVVAIVSARGYSYASVNCLPVCTR